MIEVYLFLAAFPAQIVAMSVLYPLGFSRLIRAAMLKAPAEKLTELYPDVDVRQAHERFLARYRVANTVVVLIGLALLAWFSVYMQRPGWEDGKVGALLTAYFLLQSLPIAMTAWFMKRFDRLHRRTPRDGKRKALLQRRTPFDFLSPYMIVLATLSYLLFVAVNFYVAQHPFPGYAGPVVNITIVTLMFLGLGGAMYWFLYGRKADPLQSHEDRIGMLRMLLNAYVWICVLVPLFLVFEFARKMLDIESWNPLAGTLGFLLFSILSLRTVSARPAEPESRDFSRGALPR